MLSAATAQTTTPASRPSAPFLQRQGSQLLLDGKPFRAVGVNKRELLDQYLADLLGGDLDVARSRARKTLDSLSATGIDVVRVCGCQFWPVEMSKTFAADPAVQGVAWQRFDEMLADCTRHDVRVVLAVGFYVGLWPDLANESLHDFVTNPHSRSRQMHDAWLTELVTRYRDNPTVLFWELPNELNLLADLAPQMKNGLFDSPPSVSPRPVVRDARNNLTSDEAAAWMRETATLIKSIDPNHLVGTGFSLPRPSAWHLWQGSLTRSSSMDWTVDTPEQQADYIRLMTPEPIDLISIHQYFRPGQPAGIDQLVTVLKTGRGLGKPVYVGEMGVDSEAFKGEIYGHQAACDLLRDYLQAVRSLDVPIVLAWAYDEYGSIAHEPVIWSDRQPQAVAVLRAAQRQAKADAMAQRSLSDAEIATVVGQLQRRFGLTDTQPGR
jgi:hypothetical protein